MSQADEISSSVTANPTAKIETATTLGESPAAENDPATPSAVGGGGAGQEETSRTGAANLRSALQQGLNRENLEEEVSQVVGALSSWWGGVKKQVGL